MLNIVIENLWLGLRRKEDAVHYDARKYKIIC